MATRAAASYIQKSSERIIDGRLRQMFDTLVAQPVPARLKLVAEQLALAETSPVGAAARKR